MAASKVKAALDNITAKIVQSAQQRENAKSLLLSARNQLANIPTLYAAEITEINGYGTSNVFEALSKAEKDKLQAEFLALKSALETELTALGVSYS